MSKVPLILFSGGLDSTVLLQHALIKGDVETLYVDGPQGVVKSERELHARKKIIHHLERLTGNKVRNDYVVKINEGINTIRRFKFSQPPAWIYGALQEIDGDLHSELQIGYVAGDQIISELHRIVTVWDALYSIARWGDLVPVTFPLAYHKKRDLINEVTPIVVPWLWSCELPNKKKQCGQCEACINHACAVHGWELKTGRNFEEHVKKAVRFYHTLPVKHRRLDYEVGMYFQGEKKDDSTRSKSDPDETGDTLQKAIHSGEERQRNGAFLPGKVMRYRGGW